MGDKDVAMTTAHVRVDKFTADDFDALAKTLGRNPTGAELLAAAQPYETVEDEDSWD